MRILSFCRRPAAVPLLTAVVICLNGLQALAQAPQAASADPPTAAGGPLRIRQPVEATPVLPPAAAQAGALPRVENAAPLATVPRARKGEFETFVGLPLFGAELVNDLASGAVEYSPLVPPEYVIQSGDEIQVLIWGAVDADLRLTVDRSGRINIPRVGPVLVAGLRFGDLQPTLLRRAGLIFRNFELSASLGRLRGVRVYVTGFVERPGAYAVAGLSTVLNAVMRAGGPAATGSFRSIELRRSGRLVSTLDLYDLINRGDRSGDRLVEPDDVIHVPPVGRQVAVRGSVNKQAVFEVRPGETVRDVLLMAGGFSAVGDPSRVAVERLEDRNDARVVLLTLPQSETAALNNGDVLRVFSRVDVLLSIERQNKRVRVEGEVLRPGEYVLPPDSTVADALRTAGGLTPSAYVFGAVFARESVRASQQENYERALREMETDLMRTAGSQRVVTGEEVSARSAQAVANQRFLERLRQLTPSGRIVFQLAPNDQNLPDIKLEDGDRISIPAQPTSVGVFGSVFNTGNYLFVRQRNIAEYLQMAGGPTKGADDDNIFVVRANGQVTSTRQTTGILGWRRGIAQLGVEPGDTIFVPEEMDKTTFLQAAKDWTQILFQLGVGAAGIASAVR